MRRAGPFTRKGSRGLSRSFVLFLFSCELASPLCSVSRSCVFRCTQPQSPAACGLEGHPWTRRRWKSLVDVGICGVRGDMATTRPVAGLCCTVSAFPPPYSHPSLALCRSDSMLSLTVHATCPIYSARVSPPSLMASAASCHEGSCGGHGAFGMVVRAGSCPLVSILDLAWPRSTGRCSRRRLNFHSSAGPFVLSAASHSRPSLPGFPCRKRLPGPYGS